MVAAMDSTVENEVAGWKERPFLHREALYQEGGMSREHLDSILDLTLQVEVEKPLTAFYPTC